MKRMREVDPSSFIEFAWTLLTNGIIIMAFAASVHKWFNVWGPMGYVESLAWSATWLLVRRIFHPKEEA